MLFLKRMEAFGFKSFAEPTKLDFNYEMTGIVGPNGSGKSNITDAIRWALGEQSSKSLRGNNMDDIVFSGSESYSSLNVAEVKLIFDNSKKTFNTLEFSEVEVTRRFYKQTKESEFFINKVRVRLKDIQDIALETGLTKSSLAIISQGSVNSFVEAKPEERRELFDEAAGVSIYKRRKLDAQRKLLRSQQNLDRLNDIVNEIERKLPSLKRQSNKATIFNEKSEKLKSIEVAFLVKDMHAYKQILISLQAELMSFSTINSDLKKTLVVNQNEISSLQNKIKEYEQSISKLNSKFTKIVQEIADLKIRKISLENKHSNINSSDIDKKTADLVTDFNEKNINLKLEQEKMINQREEYNKLQENNQNILKELEDTQINVGVVQRKIVRIESKIETFNHRKKTNEGLHSGVKLIIDNLQVLPGVEGIVKDLMTVNSKYEVAISSQLGGALQNIIMNSTKETEFASEFLKKNNAGTATFLPIDNLIPNYISKDQKIIIQNANGFISFANELVNVNKKYEIVIDYLLANIIIVDNFANAHNLQKLTKSKFGIVTIDGERFLPRGAIIGGKRKERNVFLNDASVIEKLETDLTAETEIEKTLLSKISDLKSTDQIRYEQMSELQSAIGATRASVEILQKEIVEIKDEFKLLSGKEIDSNKEYQKFDEQIAQLISNLAKTEMEKDNIQQELNVSTNLKDKTIAKLNELNGKFNEQRIINDETNEKLTQIKLDSARLEEKIIQANYRLTQNYNLTLETAEQMQHPEFSDEEETREQIKKLHQEIQQLGNVNIEAIEEYREEQLRFDSLQEQINDVVNSIKNLESVMTNMDKEMLIKFKSMINEVNKVLPNTFSALFGGGTAKIIYTDTENILESGIDIKISPPGKKIYNLNLLSGGEKSMVALSVLFSILKVSPLPLVILDEVEAPLDPVNVERFAKYLKQFTNNTQFLIVTHRPGTMENCDILYGVTMQQKGVTKILNVKLNDAVSTLN
ncbi:AAA family ATPase [Spiroplasma endosymbiont of Labia minor]|uniref:AAA family ATPase n=1 Tax=Spiroplasma endosymbiont of Labia minor TaxID=3066305 RepID=UPI0030CAB230